MSPLNQKIMRSLTLTINQSPPASGGLIISSVIESLVHGLTYQEYSSHVSPNIPNVNEAEYLACVEIFNNKDI